MGNYDFWTQTNNSENFKKDLIMKTTGDIWEDIGSLAEEDLFHVITKLYELYEKQLVNRPDDVAAKQFFNNLDTIINQVNMCNLNRR